MVTLLFETCGAPEREGLVVGSLWRVRVVTRGLRAAGGRTESRHDARDPELAISP